MKTKIRNFLIWVAFVVVVGAATFGGIVGFYQFCKW